MVGEIAHRIQRLLGGASGDQHLFAHHILLMSQIVEDDLQQHLRLRQLPLAHGTAGQIPAGRLHHLPAVAAQGIQIVLGHWIFVHLGVHSRYHDLGTVAGQHRGGQHIVRQAVRQLGDDVGRSRSDHHQISLVGHGDVLHLEGKIPVKGVHQCLVAGQRLKGHRRDKLCGVLGHEHLHIAPQLHQGGSQVGHFVCGDPAGDPQHHRLSL